MLLLNSSMLELEADHRLVDNLIVVEIGDKKFVLDECSKKSWILDCRIGFDKCNNKIEDT